MSDNKEIVFKINVKGIQEEIAELAALEKAIKNLTDTQKILKKSNTDESAQIAENNVKLKKLREEYRNSSQAAKAAATTNKKLTGSIVEMRKELNDARTKFDNLSASQRNNIKVGGAQLKNIQALDAKLVKLEATTGRSQRQVGRYSSALKGFGRQLAGAAGLTSGIYMFVSALKKSISISKEYEKANAVLAGVLNTNLKGTIALQEASQKLGATTAFTSTQVVKLQESLARLGKSEKEILAMTEGIINASIAMGSETGETATLIGATLNAFQMDAHQSAYVADVLTLSTQKSALSFEKLSIALPKVGSAAAAAGVSFEDMVSQLGQIVDRGIEASTAGTSLRNIYIELSKKGITYNAALKQIANSSDKLGAANALFGKRSAVTALALSETTIKADEMSEALANAGGTAQRVAETQLNTLAGKITLFNSAWEALFTTTSNNETAFIRFLKTTVELSTKLISKGESPLEKFSKSMASMTDANKTRLLGTYEQNLKKVNDSIKESYAVYSKMKSESGSFTFLKESMTGGYDKANEVHRKNLLSQQFDLENQILILKQQLSKSNDTTSKQTKTEIIQKQTLLEIQAELLKQAKEMPQNTEAEIMARNDSIAVINAEISRLKALRTIKKEVVPDKMQGKGGVNIGTVGTLSAGLYDEKGMQAKLDNDETQRLKEIEEQRQRDKIAAAEMGAQAIGMINSGLFSAINTLRNDELQTAIDADKLKLQSNTLSAQERKRLEDNIAENERKIRYKEAKANKAQAIIDIAINTAVAVSKVWGQSGIFGMFAQIPVLIMGGLQAAIVAAQPLPKLAKGGIFKGKSHAQGGIKAGGVEVEGGEPVLTKSVTTNPQDLKTISDINVKHGGVALTKYNPKNYMAAGGNIPVDQMSNIIQEIKVSLNVHELTRAQNNITLLTDASTI